MATYYVKTSGNDTTGDGSSGNPWATPGKLAASLADNDIGYVQSGTYTLSTATAGAGGPITFASGITAKICGYETTAGDDCPTGDRPVLAAGSFAPTNMVTMQGDFDDAQVLSNFVIDGNSQATSGIVGNVTGYRFNHVINCLVQDCNGAYGVRLVQATAVRAHSNSGIGFSNVSGQMCWASNNTGDGFDLASDEVIIDSIASNNAIGFDCAAYQRLVNCVAYNNSSDGFELSFNSVCVNCIAEDNGAYGFDTSSDSRLINCADYSNTTARRNTAPIVDMAPVTLTGSAFTNAAGDDFSLNNTAGGGADCRAAGIVTFGQTVQSDIGICSVIASGGGGYPRSRIVNGY